jgi:alpha-acetolactate decarboxylase
MTNNDKKRLERKNLMKHKILAALLSATVSVPMFVAPVYATNVNANTAESTSTFAEEAVLRYLYNEGEDLSNIFLSDPVSFYDFENMEEVSNVQVVFRGDSIIGVMRFDDPESAAAYMPGRYAELEEKCLAHEAVMLGTYDNSFTMYSNGEWIALDGTELSEEPVVSQSAISCCLVEKEETALTSQISGSDDVNFTIASRFKVAYELEMDDVERVPTKTVNGENIDWAASIAAKYNYIHDLYGDVRELDATSVYEIMVAVYNEKPTRSETWIVRTLDTLHLSSIYTNRSLTATEVYQEMYRRNPILIEMADGDYSEYRTALITGIRYYENGCADYFLTDGDIGITDEYDVYYKSPVFLNSDQANKRTGFLYYSDWDNKAYTNWVSTASCEIDRDED